MGLFDWLGDALGGGASSLFGGDGASGGMPPMQAQSPVSVPGQGGGAGGLYNPGGAPPPDLQQTTPMGDQTGVNPMTGPPPAPTTPPGLPTPNPAADGSPAAGMGQNTAAAAPPVPMPAPRPPGADAATPPGAAPTSGSTPTTPPGLPPGMPMDITSPQQQAMGAGGAAPGGGDSRFSLTRALGLSDNASKSIRGALGAGLKAAGNSAGKSPMQALASGAGEAIEGGSKADNTTYDQKIKALQAAVAAQAAGDKAAYNKNYAAYLGAKLKNDTDAAASGKGKSGAWNKPDSQKFIDAQHALAADPEIKASQKLLEQTAKTGTPDEIAKAQAQHTALINQKQGMYLAGVGLSPQSVADMAKNPPGSQGNPVKGITSQEDFERYVKPGQAYVNPRDGKVYIRKGGDAQGGGESAAPTASPSAPAPPGPMPGTKTDDE